MSIFSCISSGASLGKDALDVSSFAERYHALLSSLELLSSRSEQFLSVLNSGLIRCEAETPYHMLEAFEDAIELLGLAGALEPHPLSAQSCRGEAHDELERIKVIRDIIHLSPREPKHIPFYKRVCWIFALESRLEAIIKKLQNLVNDCETMRYPEHQRLELQTKRQAYLQSVIPRASASPAHGEIADTQKDVTQIKDVLSHRSTIERSKIRGVGNIIGDEMRTEHLSGRYTTITRDIDIRGEDNRVGNRYQSNGLIREVRFTTLAFNTHTDTSR